MNVTLTPRLEKDIAKVVKSGRYVDADDLIRVAVRNLLDSELVEIDFSLYGNKPIPKGNPMPWEKAKK